MIKIDKYVLSVWTALRTKIMKGYHDLFLKGIVSLLACVFETFRKEPISSFELDPAHYLSTLDAMKRFTCARLRLISDIEKYQFSDSMIRGGISVISKDYSESNNKFLKSYDPTSYIIYLDVNNSYCHSMMELLPNEILDCVNPKIHSRQLY